MNIPWQSVGPSTPTRSLSDQSRLNMATASSSASLGGNGQALAASQQQQQYRHRAPTASSSKTDSSHTTSLLTPSSGFWGQLNANDLDALASADKSVASYGTDPTIPQMMDLLFPSTKQHCYTAHDHQDCNVDAALCKFDFPAPFHSHGFAAKQQADYGSAPFTLESCPDESCNVGHLPGPTLPICCDDPHHTTISDASTICSTAGDEAYGGTTCCPPSCPSTMDSLLPCDQSGATVVCADASCSDPSCDQAFATTSKVTLQPSHSHAESCVSVCDGVVAESLPEAMYDGCGDCNTAEGVVTDPRGSFAQSLHNLFLDCCRECPDEHLDPCCPPAQVNRFHRPNVVESGIPTPAATVGTRSTPDTQTTGTPGHTTPQSRFAQSPISHQPTSLEAALRHACQSSHPHNHDNSGLCLAPGANKWRQTSLGRSGQVAAGTAAAASPATYRRTRPAAIQCKWAGCSHVASDISQLAAHVHSVHLLPQEAEPDASFEPWQASASQQHVNGHHTAFAQPSKPCQWDSCDHIDLPYGGAATADAILQHLLQAHLSDHARPVWPMQKQLSSSSSSSSPALQQDVHTSSIASMPMQPQQSRKRRLSSIQNFGSTETGKGEAPLPPPKVPTPESVWAGSVDGGHSAFSPTATSSWTEEHQCGWLGCSEHFDSHQALTDHIAQDHVGGGKSSYTCLWKGCQRGEQGKTFQQRQKILRHLQTHTGDRPYKCTVCSRRFSEANTLSQHMRTHTHEKPYLCDYPGCNARFAVAGSLTIHKRSRHTNERPFVCTWPGCNRAFAESSNLTKHRRVHSGERPFACDKCDRRFSRPDQLSRHAKIHEAKKAQS
ncbi:hypothetical protein BCV69DRAFT_212956 [Microstroma glucosiphilum]|uniref:C2H2-type domain-containing protein n=1 Tax=Pseudomicrostroma glucosiphilum TaxID=1684307 RepID=A0A316U4Z9_9BASI|nr:hypothetical protein BCV69DRAFT_212956 [Pseudomicrostroma glucosiphilum]PWN19904.1 hypothetical protein BCV69DRAFT_212956 [Pseudomicrostroma glucosiphilum]